jgi:hypothetical protein
VPGFFDGDGAGGTGDMWVARFTPDAPGRWTWHASWGGQVEFILEDLLKTEDFRRYEGMWRYTFYARKFLEENLPFWAMEPADGLLAGAAPNLGGGQVFRKRGQVYAVYLPKAMPSGKLDLRETTILASARSRALQKRSVPGLWRRSARLPKSPRTGPYCSGGNERRASARSRHARGPGS